jgi:hypothetical protein
MPKGRALNRYAITNRREVAGVVERLSGIVGSQKKLAAWMRKEPRLIRKLRQRESAELEPATFRLIYRACALAGDLATAVDLKLRLDAAVRPPANLAQRPPTPGREYPSLPRRQPSATEWYARRTANLESLSVGKWTAIGLNQVEGFKRVGAVVQVPKGGVSWAWAIRI